MTVEERQRSQIFEHCSFCYLDPPLSLLQLYAVPKSRETWLWVWGEHCQAMIGNRVPLLARAWCPVVRQLVEQSGRSAGLVLGCWVSGGGEVSGCEALHKLQPQTSRALHKLQGPLWTSSWHFAEDKLLLWRTKSTAVNSQAEIRTLPRLKGFNNHERKNRKSTLESPADCDQGR